MKNTCQPFPVNLKRDWGSGRPQNVLKLSSKEENLVWRDPDASFLDASLISWKTEWKEFS